MPTAYKILGQSSPVANTTANVYTVPSATQAVVSTIVICNRGTANASYHIAAQANGATLSNSHYIAFNSAVSSNDSIALTIGLTLSATDVLSVNASSNTITFSVFGSEIT
jgi:hypothetical protein